MASSRFPGKPLAPICGRPMVEHVFERAKLYDKWDALMLATCDPEIAAFGETRGYPVIWTSDTHSRALERVAEAVEKCHENIAEDDLVVCIQGDEPMMRPDMIDAVLAPLLDDMSVEGTVLAMEIADDAMFRNPDTVKIVHDLEGNVLYTSRAPVPYCDELSPETGARRIYGIFGFRWRFLEWFNSLPESRLEILESCDSNRICDNGRFQRIAPYPDIPSFSVDSPADLALVETHMPTDPYWGKY
jgi:3-deoxy-manno-octulosonate cytidylyltransferase (CMP-KDO synthetase)